MVGGEGVATECEFPAEFAFVPGIAAFDVSFPKRVGNHGRVNNQKNGEGVHIPIVFQFVVTDCDEYIPINSRLVTNSSMMIIVIF